MSHRPPHPEAQASRAHTDLMAATEDLDRICGADDRWGRAIDCILAALPGQPGAASYDSERISGTAPGDPTAMAGIDMPVTDLARAADLAKTVRRAADELVRMVLRHEPRKAGPLDRKASAGNDNPGCTSCARIEQAPGVPTYRRGDYTPELSGEKKRCCRWCSDWITATGVLPPKKQMQQHLDGKRVPLPNTVGTGGTFAWKDSA